MFNSKKPFFPSNLKSGLYIITCTPLNKHYVGSSTGVKSRLNTHKSTLNRGCHWCKALQDDFEKYGAKNFLFQRLLLGVGLKKKELEELETQVLLTLPPENRYNAYTNWRKRPSHLNPFYGKKHTKEARQLQSHANEGRLSPFKNLTHTNKVKQLISQQNQGTSNIERRKPLYIDGIYYESISEASDQTGLGRRLIRERCHSKDERFSNYQWAKKTTE